MFYLESSPRTSSLDTRPCRQWKAHSGESSSCLRVTSGFSLKKTGIGPVSKSKLSSNYLNKIIDDRIAKRVMSSLYG